MGGWWFCSVLRVAATSDTWFGTSTLCSAREHQPKGRNFSSPTSVLEISFCLGSVKKNSSGVVSLAFGEGLLGGRSNFCCYTQIPRGPRRLWTNGYWDQPHSLGLGPMPLVLQGQEDAADQPSRPCISLKGDVLNPVSLPRTSPIALGEWDLHTLF